MGAVVVLVENDGRSDHAHQADGNTDTGMYDWEDEKALGIIFDASGSMLQRIDGQRRIEIARNATARLIADIVPEGTFFALTAFGYTADACDIRDLVRLAPLDRRAAIDAVQQIPAINRSKTPLGHSLDRMISQMADHGGPRTIVLMTDGEETCDGDVEQVLRRAQRAGIDIVLNIVGFALDDAELVATLEEWAAIGGGTYFDTDDFDSLAAALQASAEVVVPPVPEGLASFAVFSALGDFVARVAAGEAITLQPGTYRLVDEDDFMRSLEFEVVDNLRVEINFGADGSFIGFNRLPMGAAPQ